MQNPAPTREQVDTGWTPGWVNWFQQVFQCLPWKKAFSASTTLDFGSITGQTEESASFELRGVRAGDGVQVTPLTNSYGIVYIGVVTADDTVTIYAKNYTSLLATPLPKTFRVIVKQN